MTIGQQLACQPTRAIDAVWPDQANCRTADLNVCFPADDPGDAIEHSQPLTYGPPKAYSTPLTPRTARAVWGGRGEAASSQPMPPRAGNPAAHPHHIIVRYERNR